MLDNTKGQLINFDEALMRYSRTEIHVNRNGSFKHCLSVQFLIEFCKTRDMLLFDSDTILNHSVDFIDPLVVTAADIEEKNEKSCRNGVVYRSETRFIPFIQYFNCSMMKNLGLKYFDRNRILGGMTSAGNHYDTGASFYEDVAKMKLPFKKIPYRQYIDHLEHGSWRKRCMQTA